MQRKYQECITSFTLEAGRLMKAIRSTQALADNLPGNFPAPDRILVSRKPYDLKLEWEAEHTGHQKKLQNRVTAQLHLQDVKWNLAADQAIICSTRIKVGDKDTMNIRLRIALRGRAPISS
jgi:hypothetical protein